MQIQWHSVCDHLQPPGGGGTRDVGEGIDAKPRQLPQLAENTWVIDFMSLHKRAILKRRPDDPRDHPLQQLGPQPPVRLGYRGDL